MLGLKVDRRTIPIRKMLGMTDQIDVNITGVDDGCRQPGGQMAIHARGDKTGKKRYRPGMGSGLNITGVGGAGGAAVLIHAPGHGVDHIDEYVHIHDTVLFCLYTVVQIDGASQETSAATSTRARSREQSRYMPPSLRCPNWSAS